MADAAAAAALLARTRTASAERRDVEYYDDIDDSTDEHAPGRGRGRPIARSKTMLDRKFRQYQEENRRAWIRSHSDKPTMQADAGGEAEEELSQLESPSGRVEGTAADFVGDHHDPLNRLLPQGSAPPGMLALPRQLHSPDRSERPWRAGVGGRAHTERPDAGMADVLDAATPYGGLEDARGRAEMWGDTMRDLETARHEANEPVAAESSATQHGIHLPHNLLYAQPGGNLRGGSDGSLPFPRACSAAGESTSSMPSPERVRMPERSVSVAAGGEPPHPAPRTRNPGPSRSSAVAAVVAGTAAAGAGAAGAVGLAADGRDGNAGVEGGEHEWGESLRQDLSPSEVKTCCFVQRASTGLGCHVPCAPVLRRSATADGLYEDDDASPFKASDFEGSKRQASVQQSVRFSGVDDSTEEEEEDEEEAQLREEDLDYMDKEVIQDIFNRVCAMEEKVGHYIDLCGFLLLLVIFCTILCLQADSQRSHQVLAAHDVLLPAGMTPSSPFTFDSERSFYNWLNDSVLQVVGAGPPCGDGACEPPFEFPAFGRFGCMADCGAFSNVTPIAYDIDTNFPSEGARAAASWNLCMTFPISLCWFEAQQTFPTRMSDMTGTIYVPDGDWQLVLDAPEGGVRGSVSALPSSVVRVDSVLGSAAMVSLVSFGGCATLDNVNGTDCGKDECTAVVNCLSQSCGRNVSKAELSAAYIDCMTICQKNPASLAAILRDSTCDQVALQLNHSFPMFNCPVPGKGPNGWSSPLDAHRVAALQRSSVPFVIGGSLDSVDSDRVGIAGTLSQAGGAGAMRSNLGFAVYPNNTTVWAFLGANDDQRITACQVAVARTVYTMVKDRCLAGRSAKSLTLDARNRMVALLCTLFGGPISTDPRCNFTDSSSGRQLTQPAELFDHLRAVHVGHKISLGQQHRFVTMLMAAFQSVISTSAAAAASMTNLLNSFDEAVADPSLPGCPFTASWLLWREGQQCNSTIMVGDRVTWIFAEDEPLSITVSGKETIDYFTGFGSDHLLVSRLMACSPDNVGPQDGTAVPFPCALPIPGEPANYFSYTRVFDQPGTVFYTSGTRATTRRVSKAGLSGVVTILPQEEQIFGIPSALSCAPGCPLSSLSNGVCNPECNVPDCLFDGGDCACVDPQLGPGICPCGGGMLRRDDGSCCLSSAVGSALSFPFSLRRFSLDPLVSNAAIITASTEPQPKWVGHNRVMIGVFLVQTRRNVSYCKCTRMGQLVGWCSLAQTSMAPWGVNPHFLPSSSLYDPSLVQLLQTDPSALNSNTFGAPQAFNPQGLPYGFPSPLRSRLTLVFDINLDYINTMNRLQYLVDGHYIDNATDSIEVKLITFNAEAQKLAITTFSIETDIGGTMSVSYSSDAVPTSVYGDDPYLVAVLVLEVVFVLCVLWNLWEEVREMMQCRRIYGSVFSYFDSAWNWVDLTSIALQLTGVVLWITLWICTDNFTMEPRYNVYQSLGEVPRYWGLPNPPTGFVAAYNVYQQSAYLVYVHDVYFTIQGVNLFLILVRALKLMDFQPYLGVVTRSLSMAALSLVHFFILAFLIFVSFSIYAYAIFGDVIDKFSTLEQSMLTCFMILIQENSVFYSIMYLDGWSHGAALIFWFLYIILMVFILFNFLIAIIVDAFMDIKESAGLQTTIFQDMLDIWRYAKWCVRGPFRSAQDLERRLIDLGAVDERYNDSKHILNRYRSVHRRVNNFFAPFFKRKMMSGRMEQPVLRIHKQRVLKIKDNPIDGEALGVILDRRARRAQAERQKLQPASSFSSGSKRSATQVVAEKLSSGMRSITHAFSGKRTTTSLSASSRAMGVDTEALTNQVIAQFGQLVDTVGSELPPVISRKRRDAEILKEGVRQTLAGVAQGVNAMDELREAMNRIEMEQQDLRLQLTVVVDLIQQLMAKKPKRTNQRRDKSGGADSTRNDAGEQGAAEAEDIGGSFQANDDEMD